VIQDAVAKDKTATNTENQIPVIQRD